MQQCWQKGREQLDVAGVLVIQYYHWRKHKSMSGVNKNTKTISRNISHVAYKGTKHDFDVQDWSTTINRC